MNETHTGSMPWDDIFNNEAEHYTLPRIVKVFYEMKPVKVIKELWDGRLIEEIID